MEKIVRAEVALVALTEEVRMDSFCRCGHNEKQHAHTYPGNTCCLICECTAFNPESGGDSDDEPSGENEGGGTVLQCGPMSPEQYEIEREKVRAVWDSIPWSSSDKGGGGPTLQCSTEDSIRWLKSFITTLLKQG